MFLDDDHSSCVLVVIGRRELEHGLRFCKWRLTVEEKFWRAVRSTVRIDQVCFVLTIMHLITQNDIRVNDWLNGGAMASCIVYLFDKQMVERFVDFIIHLGKSITSLT